MNIKMAIGMFKKMILLAAILTLASPAFAQNVTPADSGLHLILSPHYLNLTTEPGKSVSGTLKVQNLGNKTEDLQISLMKFTANDTSGVPKVMDREPGDDFFDWVTFSEEKFSVLTNQWKDITVTIKPPSTAAFGYYYVFAFTRVNENVTGGGKAIVQGAPSILGLLNVQVPGAKKEARLVKIETDHKIYEYLPVTLKATIENTGDIHLAPSGNAFITRGGDNVATLDVNLTKGNILPKSMREFDVAWVDGFPQYVDKIQDGKKIVDKNGKNVQDLRWEFSQASKFRIGKYTAHLLMVYDNGSKDIPLEGYVSFWIIPWKIILAGIVVIVLIVLGIWQIIKPMFSRRLKS